MKHGFITSYWHQRQLHWNGNTHNTTIITTTPHPHPLHKESSRLCNMWGRFYRWNFRMHRAFSSFSSWTTGQTDHYYTKQRHLEEAIQRKCTDLMTEKVIPLSPIKQVSQHNSCTSFIGNVFLIHIQPRPCAKQLPPHLTTEAALQKETLPKWWRGECRGEPVVANTEPSFLLCENQMGGVSCCLKTWI